MSKLKDYLEYRKNSKIAKRVMAKMLATSLPAVCNATSKGTGIVKFIIKLAEASKTTSSEDLYPMIIDNAAEVLKTTDNRLKDILIYLASLSPEDMQKIIVHSMVQSNPELKDKKE